MESAFLGPTNGVHLTGEQEPATAGEGGLSESGLEEGDDGFKGAYHSPHGGTSRSLEPVMHLQGKDMRNPLFLHLLRVRDDSGQRFR
jgi:hypothetical protein